jgi:hypothetical protein
MQLQLLLTLQLHRLQACCSNLPGATSVSRAVGASVYLCAESGGLLSRPVLNDSTHSGSHLSI